MLDHILDHANDKCQSASHGLRIPPIAYRGNIARPLYDDRAIPHSVGPAKRSSHPEIQHSLCSETIVMHNTLLVFFRDRTVQVPDTDATYSRSGEKQVLKTSSRPPSEKSLISISGLYRHSKSSPHASRATAP